MSPEDFYTPAEAAVALGWSRSQMTRAMEHGVLQVTQDASGARIGWQELAVMLTARYPQAEIESALGPAMASVIPEAIRLTEFRVRIPRYQVVMLEKLAGRERISVDELMSRHLLDLAGAEADWLRRRVCGFEAAMRWPEE
jgi:hypothetical protein